MTFSIEKEKKNLLYPFILAQIGSYIQMGKGLIINCNLQPDFIDGITYMYNFEAQHDALC